LTWHISPIIIDYFSLVLTTYVINQSRRHRLLSDAFHSTISISFKLKEPKNAPSFKTLMEEDSGVALELICLTSNIRKRFVEFLIVFVPS